MLYSCWNSCWYNTNNDQAVMVHTVEAHGQTKIVNSRYESFDMIKGKAQSTSLPPPVIKLYPDVWPVSLYHSDG